VPRLKMPGIERLALLLQQGMGAEKAAAARDAGRRIV